MPGLAPTDGHIFTRDELLKYQAQPQQAQPAQQEPKKYDPPLQQEQDPSQLDDDSFYKWLAGISSGEATFYSRVKPLPSGKTTIYNEFKIALRIDDMPMLEAIHDRLKVGSIQRIKASNQASAQAAFRVFAQDELYNVIVPIFDQYKLSSKKEKDFLVWREIVKLCVETDPTENINKIAPLVEQLKAGRHEIYDNPQVAATDETKQENQV